MGKVPAMCFIADWNAPFLRVKGVRIEDPEGHCYFDASAGPLMADFGNS